MTSNAILQTIAVSPEVKRALAAKGSAGMSYNDVLKQLLKIQSVEAVRKK